MRSGAGSPSWRRPSGAFPPSGSTSSTSGTLCEADEESACVKTDEILDAIKAVLVERLKFDPARAAGITPDTILPKGIDESLDLDSLDFIELAMGIEEIGRASCRERG